MTENRDKPTRRQFFGMAAAGGAGATLGTLGAHPAAGSVENGRAHYQVFQPGKIGPLTLKNRMCRSAFYSNTGSANPQTEGEVTEDTIRLFTAYAEGEVAMAMTGYMAVMEYGKKRTHICASHDKFIPGLARLAEAVHGVGNDCKIVAEIGHDGTAFTGGGDDTPRTLSPTGVEWGSRISPSGLNWRGEPEGHTLTEAEIVRFCDDMAQAARRLKEAGWDGCNIHGAHHYLISTFLSPYTNRRTDKYGGSVENRVEIVRETVGKIREQTGSDFAIIIKLNCDDGSADDGTPGEIDIDTFPAIAKLVEATGVDAIDVSGDDPIRTGINSPEKQSYYKAYTARLNGVKVPIMLSGGNRNVELLEELFKEQQGNIDFYNLARPLIRQPYLVKQWLEGGDANSECINVSLCFRALYQSPPRPVYCVVLERQKEAERQARLQATSPRGTAFGA